MFKKTLRDTLERLYRGEICSKKTTKRNKNNSSRVLLVLLLQVMLCVRTKVSTYSLYWNHVIKI